MTSGHCPAQQVAPLEAQGCGAAFEIASHAQSTTRYVFAAPAKMPNGEPPVTLVLLPGGAGYLDFDDRACPRALKGNWLVRSQPLFAAAGFATALVDAPSDHQGEDGLAGFRTSPLHAEDIGKVIVALRSRTNGEVWIVGSSRGSISAANAGARLAGMARPDGIVLASMVTVGQTALRKPWVAQTVFDLPLESIQVPVLMLGHGADQCIRSPAGQMLAVATRIKDERQQVVTVMGEPGKLARSAGGGCEGRSRHGFWGQEAEIVDGISRFIRDGRY